MNDSGTNPSRPIWAELEYYPPDDGTGARLALLPALALSASDR